MNTFLRGGWRRENFYPTLDRLSARATAGRCIQSNWDDVRIGSVFSRGSQANVD